MAVMPPELSKNSLQSLLYEIFCHLVSKQMPHSQPTLHENVVGDAVAAEVVLDGAREVAAVLPPHGLHLQVRLEPEHAPVAAAGIPRPGVTFNRILNML